MVRLSLSGARALLHLPSNAAEIIREVRALAFGYHHHVAAAGYDDPARLAQHLGTVPDEVQHPYREGPVDRVGRDGQLLSVADGNATGKSSSGAGQHRRRQIDADHVSAHLAQATTDHAGAYADLKQPALWEKWAKLGGVVAAALHPAARFVVLVGDPIEAERLAHVSVGGS